MEEYYDQKRTIRLRKKIRSFEQLDGELFHEAWERFKQIVLECPHHSCTQEVLNIFGPSSFWRRCRGVKKHWNWKQESKHGQP